MRRLLVILAVLGLTSVAAFAVIAGGKCATKLKREPRHYLRV